MTFHLMTFYMTKLFFSVKVTERPPFRKELLIGLTVCFLCIMFFVLFELFPGLVLRGTGF